MGECSCAAAVCRVAAPQASQVCLLSGPHLTLHGHQAAPVSRLPCLSTINMHTHAHLGSHLARVWASGTSWSHTESRPSAAAQPDFLGQVGGMNESCPPTPPPPCAGLGSLSVEGGQVLRQLTSGGHEPGPLELTAASASRGSWPSSRALAPSSLVRDGGLCVVHPGPRESTGALSGWEGGR